MKDMTAYKEAFRTMPSYIQEAEVHLEFHQGVSVSVSEGKRSGVEFSGESALYMRVSGDKTGYYYTQDLEENPEKGILLAYENSLYSEQEEKEEIERACKKKEFGEEYPCWDVDKLTEIGLALLKKLEDCLKRTATKVHAWATLRAECVGQQVVNSYGMEVTCVRPLYVLDFGAGVELEGQLCGAGLSLAAGDYKTFDVEQAAKEILMKCRVQIQPKKAFVSGEYPVILSNSVVYYIFATGWLFFSGIKYLDHTTALSGRLGEQIAGDCLCISDQVLEKRGFGTCCDCEGTEGQTVTVLQNGVWKEPLHNRTTAKAMNQTPKGNGGRRALLSGSISTDILVTPKNFCIEPGNSSLDEMKQHMGDGILIVQSFDLFHTLDIVTGNFSIPCHGIRVEGGKETDHLMGLTMTGNFCELLKHVAEVGKERMVHPMVALENYGIQSCPIRLEKVQLSGE